jgi:hypothetical protein
MSMSFRRAQASLPPPAPAPPPSMPAVQQQQHTLVLLQGGSKASSKQYSEYESVADAMDGICSLYEYQLTSASAGQQQHASVSVHYDISELFAFIDRLHDLAVLVYSPQLRAYEPHDKQWIKSMVYEHLKQQAGGG